MNGMPVLLKAVIVLVAIAFCLAIPAVGAQDDPLELLVGRWNVRVTTLQPKKSEMSYTETYEWVLDRKFLRGQTEQKTDGTKDISYGTYDANLHGYPFWIFSSTGSYTYLAPATWDARKRTLEFKNPPGADLYYNTVVAFPDERTRRWTLIIKNWKGQVLLQQEGSAVRREN
jgi:hypothetical protein